MIHFFTAETNIRVENSNELVKFLIRKYGTPIDLRRVMRYFGYKGTPLFGACLLWNQGRKLSPFEKVETLFLEGCQALTQSMSEQEYGNASYGLRSYVSTYLSLFKWYKPNYHDA